MKNPTFYFDSSRVTRPSEKVVATLHSLSKDYWHSPFELTKKSEQSIQDYFKAPERSRFYLTTSASEGFSHILESICLKHISKTGKNHIIAAADDLFSAKMIEKWEPLGVTLKKVLLNSEGQVTANTLSSLLSPRTSFVTLPWANGLTGVIYPIWEIANLCREKGILFHVDASAILGKYYFSFSDIPIDFLTFEGSLIHAPTGSGGLLVRDNETIFPFRAKQQRALFASLACACEEMEEYFDHTCLETARLRNTFETHIKKGFLESEVLFQSSERLPHVSCIAFPGIFHELLAFTLNEKGLSAGFAVENGLSLESMLKEIGVEPTFCASALSFSLSRETTESEIEQAAAIIVEEAQRLKTFSRKVFA